MGLSNAERQKRYREKLKAAARGNATAKLATTSDDVDDTATADAWGDLLNAHYHAGGRRLLERHVDGDTVEDLAQASLDEFHATSPTALEQLEIMEAAGEAAACKIMGRRADEWYRSRPKAPAAPVEPTSATKRRGNRSVT
jgi:hypothetical protein